MPDVIEHGSDEDGVVSVGEGERKSLVPIKVYQDIYHQITGRSEEIAKRYTENLLIDFSEIEQLHLKIIQLCDIHDVIAQNTTITVYHSKDRKDQFTSFDHFRTYNANATAETTSVVLQYNFAIIPPNFRKPQEYKVHVRLMSRLSAIKELKRDAPIFISGSMIGMYSQIVVEARISYVDYVIARSFTEAIDEWVEGCHATPPGRINKALQRISHLFPQLGTPLLALMFLALWPRLDSRGDITNATIFNELVVFGVLLFFTVSLGRFVLKMLESTIDSWLEISYLKLTRGDEKLVRQFQRKNASSVFWFLFNCAVTLILGIAAAKLAIFI